MSDPEIAAWLASGDADEALAAASAALGRSPRDPLAAGAAVRRALPDLPSDRVAAALAQADLRRVATQRYGLASGGLLLTRPGLEQATRTEVADRRAEVLRASGARRVLDLTGGLGFDVSAFLRAGLAVTVLERDPVTARYLAHNAPGARVLGLDATAPGVLGPLLADLTADDVVFVDPARRDPAGPSDLATGRARPERDPARWSPSWPFIASIRHPKVAAKVAPAFTPPEGWQAEWVSVHRTVVECSVYSWPALPHSRGAVVMTGSGPIVVADSGAAVEIAVAAHVGPWVHEPDPAIVRAGVLAGLTTSDPTLQRIDPGSTWLTSSGPPATPGVLRSYRVVAELRGSTKEQRRQLTGLGVRTLTVKSRDVDVEPGTVLRSLGVIEGGGPVLILTRRAGSVARILTEPVDAGGSRSG